MIDFTGWTKRDGELHLDGFDDVIVRIGDSSDDGPFIGNVGFFWESFRDLASAMTYAANLAHERAVLLGPDPLPTAETEETPVSMFFSARGLTDA